MKEIKLSHRIPIIMTKSLNDLQREYGFKYL